jgi:hypothetical protein
MARNVWKFYLTRARLPEKDATHFSLNKSASHLGLSDKNGSQDIRHHPVTA